MATVCCGLIFFLPFVFANLKVSGTALSDQESCYSFLDSNMTVTWLFLQLLVKEIFCLMTCAAACFSSSAVGVPTLE